jgi:hypothetical protein
MPEDDRAKALWSCSKDMLSVWIMIRLCAFLTLLALPLLGVGIPLPPRGGARPTPCVEARDGASPHLAEAM